MDKGVKMIKTVRARIERNFWITTHVISSEPSKAGYGCIPDYRDEWVRLEQAVHVLNNTHSLLY